MPPRFFPSLTGSNDTQICDPWDTQVRPASSLAAQVFMTELRRAPRSSCTHCLPDCQATSYSIATSSATLRPCSQLNEGLSSLCKYSSPLVPPRWSEGLGDLFAHLASPPAYLAQFTGQGGALRRSREGEEYSAYREDIALVHLYWDTSSVLQFQRSLRLTWIDYLSQVRVRPAPWHLRQVGGLFGLMLGFSLVSFLEILYWLTARLARNCVAKVEHADFPRKVGVSKHWKFWTG